MKKIGSFFKDENGQGMVEYGLIIALVAVVVIGAIALLGGSIKGLFGDTASVMADPEGYASQAA